MTKNNQLVNRLEETITTISDFPKKGIQFKDITPIFLDPSLYQDVIEELANFSYGKVDAKN